MMISLKKTATFVGRLALILALSCAPLSPLAAKNQHRPAASAVPAVLDVAVDHGVPITLAGPASSVFIANPDVADIQVLSPTSIMVFGKRTGQTTLMASDSDGVTLVRYTVMVTQDLEDLRLTLNTSIPNHKIDVESVPNGIVLTGEAKDIGVIEDARRLALRYVPKEGEIINRIKVTGSNQIQIRVRFAEVSRDVDKRFGIDWQSIGNVGGFNFGLATGASVLEGSGVASLLNRNRPTSGSNINDILSFSTKGKGYNVNGLIDALAQEGFVTLLAEPNLTAMSGETASFLAGGEFPIPVPQSATTTTIEWKNYGVSLAFTPTLIGGSRINLHVRPEVSQLTDAGAVTLNGITVPALTTRRAETTIELASGQSFAIGGLLDNNQTQSVGKYPFLGDIPILGTLFRSTRFQNNQSELVIIITPYVVKPAQEKQLTLPTDGFSAPSDTDLIFDHRSTNSDPSARTMSGEPAAVKVDRDTVAKADRDEFAPVDVPVRDEAKPVPPSSEKAPADQAVIGSEPVAPALKSPPPPKPVLQKKKSLPPKPKAGSKAKATLKKTKEAPPQAKTSKVETPAITPPQTEPPEVIPPVTAPAPDAISTPAQQDSVAPMSPSSIELPFPAPPPATLADSKPIAPKVAVPETSSPSTTPLKKSKKPLPSSTLPARPVGPGGFILE